jgi:hypothetical protein
MSIVFGFDARERWVPRERTAARAAETFFLRPSVEKVLSADRATWPTIFRGSGSDHLGLEDLSIGATGLERPKWIGFLDGPWEDLAQLLAHAARSPPARPYSIIALSATDDSPSRDFPWLAANPATLDERWRLLGYDVTDEGLISGLSNCGYSPDEAAALIPQWAPHINEFHLFDDADRARAFCDLTDGRVLEHAPFHVIGVWELVSRKGP